jgi:TPR repeat protein
MLATILIRAPRLVGALAAFALIVGGLLPPVEARATERRAKPEVKLALVVGAGSYPFRPLANPRGDAALVADKLTKLDGFDSVILLNEQDGKPLTRDALIQAVSSLTAGATKAARSGKDVTVFFYFAGHGVEADGESRLVPPSAVSLLGPDPDPSRIDAETVSAQDVLDKFMASGAARVLIVLDACRDNPWPTATFRAMSTASAAGAPATPIGPAPETRGLGLVPLQTDDNVDTMIMFAAAARHTADDDQPGTRHSPFANALAVNLGVRGLSVREMFENVRSEVYAATDHRQKPDLSGLFEYDLIPESADGVDHTTGDDFLKSELKNGRGIAEIEALTKKGDGFSEWLWGVAELTGIATPKDEADAARWIRSAVADGTVRATVTLAYMDHHGYGVTLDHREGAAWDRFGADRKIAVAMNNLGKDYAEGWGVEKDLVQAARWYRAAADDGLFLAKINLAEAYADGAGLPRDYNAAVAWYENAANAGSLPAMDALGDLYATGDPPIAAPLEAVRWYRRAADAGDPTADRRLADMYAYGQGVAKDPVLAMSWSARAFARSRELADAGDVDAEKVVADSYEDGLNGLPPDHRKAVDLYRLAAAQGDEEAKTWLSQHNR